MADLTLPWLRGQRERDPPHQKRRRRLLSRTRGPDGSSWVLGACATRSNIRPSGLRHPRPAIHVARSARYPRAERSAYFQTSTEPFYAARPDGASPGAAEEEQSTRDSAVPPERPRGAASPSPRRRSLWRGGAQRPNPKNRPEKASRGRSPGTRESKNFTGRTHAGVTPSSSPLCAWKRAQNLAFSRTSHP